VTQWGSGSDLRLGPYAAHLGGVNRRRRRMHTALVVAVLTIALHPMAVPLVP
jgi:hypothetical protein